MSQRIEIELNREGVKELLRSQSVEKVCKEYADKAIGRLGEGYESTTYVGRNRVNASVSAVTKEAVNKNLKSNTVLKAVCGK